MTTQTEALKLALEALGVAKNFAAVHNDSELEYAFEYTLKKLDKALAQQPQNEVRGLSHSNEQIDPDVWGISPPFKGEDGRLYAYTNERDWALSLEKIGHEITPFYTHPPVPTAQLEQEYQGSDAAKAAHMMDLYTALGVKFGEDPFAVIAKMREQQLEQSNEQVEPVAWVQDVEFEQSPEFAFSWVETRLHNVPLYTHPPVPTAQPKEPEQEPIAKVCHDFENCIGWNPNAKVNELPEGAPLYTAPPQRKPMTDEQIKKDFEKWAKENYSQGFEPYGDSYHNGHTRNRWQGWLAAHRAIRADFEEATQRTWVGMMRGIRVDGDTVVISVKGGNDAARELCGYLIDEMN